MMGGSISVSVTDHGRCSGADTCSWLSCRLTIFVSAVVMFILLGVGVARFTTSHLGHKYIPWPHWAWWVAVVNSWLWAGLAIVARKGTALTNMHPIGR